MAALVPNNDSTPQQGCNNRGGKLRTVQCDLVFQSASRLIFLRVDAKTPVPSVELSCVEHLNWNK